MCMELTCTCTLIEEIVVKQAHDINYKLEYVIISKRVHFNILE